MTLTGITWDSAPRATPSPKVHPWLAAAFCRGQAENELLHLLPQGQPQSTERGLYLRTKSDWLACAPDVFAGRRMAFYGGVAGFVRLPAAGIVDGRFSGRLDATTADGVAAPFFGQVIGRDSSPDTIRAGGHAGGTGSFELGQAWIFGRDCTPSTLLRLRESVRSSGSTDTEGDSRDVRKFADLHIALSGLALSSWMLG